MSDRILNKLDKRVSARHRSYQVIVAEYYTRLYSYAAYGTRGEGKEISEKGD